MPCQCSSRKVEFVGLPLEDVHRKIRRINDVDYCICSDFDDYPKSTMSTSTRSDCKYCACPDVEVRSTLLAGSRTEEELRQVVPKLDLSFLNKACSCSDNPVLSNRFSYVTYQEVCEIPASTRSLESSSVLSGLEARKTPQLRRRRIESTEIHSPSYESIKAQNHKVQEYYQKTRQPCINQEWQQKQKRRSIGDMFRKILPKVTFFYLHAIWYYFFDNTQYRILLVYLCGAIRKNSINFVSNLIKCLVDVEILQWNRKCQRTLIFKIACSCLQTLTN